MEQGDRLALVAELLSRAGVLLRTSGLESTARAVETILADFEPGESPGPRPLLASARPNVLRCEGDYWFVVFEKDAFRLRDSRGLHYLAALLGRPGREVHALDLVGSAGTDRGPLSEAPDATARAAYRQRLEDLQEDLVEAEAFGDTERAAIASQEIDAVAKALTHGRGLGGRARPVSSAAERARQAVTKALKSAVKRIDACSPALGRHLASTVRTGTFCSYTPDPRVPVDWRTTSS